jgi:predicted N-acyltransferase
VPGPRLLRRPGAGVPISAMASALEQACESHGLSSVHVTFCTEDEWAGLGEAGWLRRIGMQFHWENEGYADFEGFLGALSSRKRKVLRRERRDANACGLTFHALSGADITERHWDAFYGFYQSTVDRKWGSAYLTRKFFSLLGERLGGMVVLMYAENDGKPVAGALNLAGDEALYGRNWGCRGDWPFLHFELCYYRAIDWAIEHGLKRVEAGAQGRHKIQRGYLPKHTYSAHWIAHAGLRRAVASFLVDECAGIEAEMAGLAEDSPFRKGED